ncbi:MULTISPECIES: hypothetical protein [unclassified Rummeliibacillus]|uniref:hypothetical protein n=1 Tax=unclassified Rummeliibacillus TaxID=2622809 RepID=UPI000E66F1FE|nr:MULTISPECIES: hypothetical protein [unclassified Rummeliibacillus]RIJ64234.1 hypothetical protein D1606_11435 [Rummeliibacillus sp. POC4]RPJ95096.1 hypothetical protein CW357_12000 [Rummeliibacillus sp. TYF005]
MSGKRMALIVVGIVLICLLLVYISISAFYKNNPHQPNQQSLGFSTEVTQGTLSRTIFIH